MLRIAISLLTLFAFASVYAYKANPSIRSGNGEYEDEKYRILGACCYTKVRNGNWITGNEYPIDFSTYPVRKWFYQDECWDVSVDFFDTYVEIVKKK